jgi:type VI secretion system protein ImpG
MARAFQPDLESLSKLAQSFARLFPAVAPRLAERSADPDVERLVEAFAYLTERVHVLLDGTAPTAAQFFTELLLPELSRPFPAATVLEVAAPRGARVAVAEGAEFDSVPVDGSPCRFRAWSAFDLVPWSVEDARVAWSAAEGQTLEVTLRSSDANAAAMALASLFPLRLHFTGDARTALTLLLFMRCHLASAELRVVAPEETSVPLSKSVRPWGLRADEALLPPEPFEHSGIRLLREYLVLPAKFAFVELGLLPGTVPENLPAATRVELRFRFDAQLPTTMLVTRDNLRVNCVPVANVFETTADPVLPTLEKPTQPLRPAGLPLGHGETYAVTRVQARIEGRPGVVPVASFSEFEAAAGDTLQDAYYVARSVPRAGGGNEVHLSVASPVDAGPLPAIDFLSVEIHADNGALANALGIGDVCIPTARSPRGLAFRNVSAVTTYRAPASGEDLRWRTLAVMALGAVPLARAETLKTLLHVLDLHPLGDAQAARAHALRLEAILSVSAAAGRARHSVVDAGGDELGGDVVVDASQRGTVVVGHEVSVEIGRSGFDGEGDALIFASVLAALFAHEASLGAFVRTTVRVAETGRVFTSAPLHADRSFESAPSRVERR